MQLGPMILIGIAFVGLCFLVYCKLNKLLTYALFVKTGVSMLFIALAVWGAIQPVIAEAGLGFLAFFIVIGLVMGLLGDIWLDLKSLHKEFSRTYMNAGFTSFGIGHFFFFVGLFCYLGGTDFSLMLWPLLGGIAMVLIINFTEKPLKLKYGDFKRISLIYSFIIAATMILSLVLTLSPANTQPEFTLLFFIGMVLFLASDLILSNLYFSVKKSPYKVLMPVNYLLYYGGQFVIAASLLFIVAG